MTNASGDPRSAPPPEDEQFSVPVPLATRPTGTGTAAAQTVPAPPPASGPLAPGYPQGVQPSPQALPTPVAPARPSHVTDPDTDPLLARIGHALFWVAVGWWAFVLVRILGEYGRTGWNDAILFHNIDRYPEESVVAAIVACLGAAVLLYGRGDRGRDRLGWLSGLVAVATVAATIWRLLP